MTGDIVGGTPGDWIVCGWFTEDDTYRPLATRLAASLNAVQAPHHFMAAPPISGGWEVNTLAKPTHVRAAMMRYPDKAIIFLDVDCIAKRDLAPLVHSVRSDIAIRWRPKARRNRTFMTPRSSTMVFRPTEAARQFAEAWDEASMRSEYGAIDQTTFITTLCRSPGVTFSTLSLEWGAMDDDHFQDAAIVHLGASNEGVTKIRGLRYTMGHLLRRLPAPLGR